MPETNTDKLKNLDNKSETIEKKIASELVQGTRGFLEKLNLKEEGKDEIDKYLESVNLPTNTEGWNDLIRRAGLGDEAVITEANKEAEAFLVYEKNQEGNHTDNWYKGVENLLAKSKEDLWKKFESDLKGFVPVNEEEVKNETHEQKQERAKKVLEFLKKIFDTKAEQNEAGTALKKEIAKTEKKNEMNEDQVNNMIPLLCSKLLEQSRKVREAGKALKKDPSNNELKEAYIDLQLEREEIVFEVNEISLKKEIILVEEEIENTEDAMKGIYQNLEGSKTLINELTKSKERKNSLKEAIKLNLEVSTISKNLLEAQLNQDGLIDLAGSELKNMSSELERKKTELFEKINNLISGKEKVETKETKNDETKGTNETKAEDKKVEVPRDKVQDSNEGNGEKKEGKKELTNETKNESNEEKKNTAADDGVAPEAGKGNVGKNEGKGENNNEKLESEIDSLKVEIRKLEEERDTRWDTLKNSDRGSRNYQEIDRFNKEIEKIKALISKKEEELKSLREQNFNLREFILKNPELEAKYGLLQEIMDRIIKFIKIKNTRVSDSGGEDTFKRDIEISEFYNLLKNKELADLLHVIKELENTDGDKTILADKLGEFAKKIKESVNKLENDKNDGIHRGHKNYEETFRDNQEIEELSFKDYDKNLDILLDELLKTDLPDNKRTEIEALKEEVKTIKEIINNFKDRIRQELNNRNPNYSEINNNYQVIQILRGFIHSKLNGIIGEKELEEAEEPSKDVPTGEETKVEDPRSTSAPLDSSELRRAGAVQDTKEERMKEETERNPEFEGDKGASTESRDEKREDKEVAPVVGPENKGDETPKTPDRKVDQIEIKSTSVDVSGIVNKFAERIAEKRYNTEVQDMNIFKRGWNRWRTKNEKINKYKQELIQELNNFYSSKGTSTLREEYRAFAQDINDCKNQCEAFAIRVARHQNNGIDKEITNENLKANVQAYLLGNTAITEGDLRAQYQAYVQNNKTEVDFDTRMSSEDFIHNLRREKANYQLNLQLIDLAENGSLDSATVENLVQNFRSIWIEDPRFKITPEDFENLNALGKKKLANHLTSVLNQEIDNLKLYFKVFNKGAGENKYTDEGAFSIDKSKEEVIDNAGFFKKAMRTIGKFAEKHPVISAVVVGGLGVGSAFATGGLSAALLAGSAVTAGVASSSKKLAQREKGFDNYENQRTQGLPSPTERLQMLETDPTYGPDGKVKRWLLKKTLKKEAKFYDPFFEEMRLESAKEYSDRIMNFAKKSELTTEEKEELKELLKEAQGRINYRNQTGHNILKSESADTIEADLGNLERAIKFADDKHFSDEQFEALDFVNQGKQEKAKFDKEVTMEAWRDFLLKAGMVAAAGATAQYLRGTGMFRKTVENVVERTGVDILTYVNESGTPEMKKALGTQNFEEVLRLLKEAEKNGVIDNLNAKIEHSFDLLPEIEKLLKEKGFDPNKLEHLLQIDIKDNVERNKYLWNYLAEAYGGNPGDYPMPLVGDKITPFPGLSGAKHAELCQLIQDLNSDYLNNMITQIDPMAKTLTDLADNVSTEQLKNALNYLSSDRIGIPGSRQVLELLNNGATSNDVLQYLQNANDNQLTSNLLNALDFGQRGAIIDQPQALLQKLAEMKGTLDVLGNFATEPGWQDYALSLVGALYAPGAAYNSELPKKEDPNTKVQDPNGQEPKVQDPSTKDQGPSTKDQGPSTKEQGPNTQKPRTQEQGNGDFRKEGTMEIPDDDLEKDLQWFKDVVQGERAQVKYMEIPDDISSLSESQINWVKEVYPKIKTLGERIGKINALSQNEKGSEEYEGKGFSVLLAEANFRKLLEQIEGFSEGITEKTEETQEAGQKAKTIESHAEVIEKETEKKINKVMKKNIQTQVLNIKS